MPIYLNALLMLAATVAAFVLLARLAHAIRGGRLGRRWQRTGGPAGDALVRVEEACTVDAKRRLVAVRCGAARVFILTGGPADLVVARSPLVPAPLGAAQVEGA